MPGFALAFRAPFFKEFALRCPRPAAEVNAALLREGIVGGYDLGRDYSDLADCLLFCVTEMHTRADIDRLAEALGKGATR